MTPIELRSTLSITCVYFLRMLGIFIVYPIFLQAGDHYAGGRDLELLGVALGVYGLLQGMVQIPMGILADRIGRKPIIILGLLVFSSGSFICMLSTGIYALILGRSLQGLGVISMATSALLADQTRPQTRTLSMAFIGISISLAFALAIIISPILFSLGQAKTIFFISGLLSLISIPIMVWWVPAELPRSPESSPLPNDWSANLKKVLTQPDLWRLYLGVFFAFTIQLANWVFIPAPLTQIGIHAERQSLIYLPTLLISMVLMFILLMRYEKLGRLRFLLRASILSLLAYESLVLFTHPLNLWMLGLALVLFFSAINVIESIQPSWVSRLVPPEQRATALAVYHCWQSFGIFFGGLLGGFLAQWGQVSSVLSYFGILAVWLLLTWNITPLSHK
ncbi:MAG: MFS transporter [Gammaproteobacteria bacterium]|nr:MFS transporter [Gammaproteobacteria bacterium]